MGSTNFGTNQSCKRTANTFIENYNAFEKGQFNDFLKELMAIESEIERIKIDLSINPDFNCEDAFRMFELDGRDFLDKDDLKYGLNLLNLYPTDHELGLLIKRFDLQKQGVITYADFFDIIVPFEKENRTLVEERLPRSCCSCRSIDAFSFGTINTLKNLFNLIINAENQINNMRRSMGTLRIKLRDIFGLIDSMKRGYFNNGDLLVYLQKEGILVDDKDVDLLFIRLDKNRNGKIDYREVEDELQTLYYFSIHIY
jgi:Ca2+-binding EF-hand superfamily protein